MLLWQFLFSFIATVCVTCMISLYQPFMELWMGKDLLLSFHNVILICVLFFTGVIQNAYFLYLSGNGLWWEMRWVYISSTVANLILNIVLGKIMGITGIILSTLISTVAFGLIWQSAIIFKSYFQKGTKQFHLRQTGYLAVCIVSSAGAYFLNKLIGVDGIPGLFAKLIVCVIVSLSLQALVYHKTKEYSHAVGIMKAALKK